MKTARTIKNKINWKLRKQNTIAIELIEITKREQSIDKNNKSRKQNSESVENKTLTSIENHENSKNNQENKNKNKMNPKKHDNQKIKTKIRM